jgi:hypothetical protein
MIDPHEYAKRCAKGRSRETQKQRIASTENLIRAIQSDTLRWAAEQTEPIDDVLAGLFRKWADAIGSGT